MKMSKYLTLLLFITTLNFAFAESSRRATRVEKDTSYFLAELESNESIFKFSFSILYFAGDTSSQPVRYSIDGVEYEQLVPANTNLKISTTPGKHIFQIMYSEDYEEVFTDSLDILAQHVDVYQVSLQMASIDVIYFKPVIYLYPEMETEVEVAVNIKGTKPFFYPEYNDGWKCTAKPNGELTIGDDTYNYLFWEADGKDQLNSENINEGFYVKGSNAVTFLEDKLTTAGFTSKEKADFITFWGPKIQSNSHNFIRFEFNDVCDKFADLNITPNPDNIYRIYILIAPLTEEIIVNPQEIIQMNREGFTVIEWGGQMSSEISINAFNIF